MLWLSTTIAHYSVDQQRVYLCGFSMGGFMTYRMAIQSNGKFAAFASMSGTIGSGISTFNPARHVPIAHWHGTADSTVFFTNNTYGLDPDSVVALWVNNNACNPVPDTTRFTNAVLADSITVEMHRFSGILPTDEVRFYIMKGAGHEVLFQPSNDITEPMEIWMFFRQYRWLQAGIADAAGETATMQFFPNPAVDYISILSNGKGLLEVLDITGKRVLTGVITEASQVLDIRDLNSGMYFVKFSNGNSSTVQKLIVPLKILVFLNR